MAYIPSSSTRIVGRTAFAKATSLYSYLDSLSQPSNNNVPEDDNSNTNEQPPQQQQVNSGSTGGGFSTSWADSLSSQPSSTPSAPQSLYNSPFAQQYPPAPVPAPAAATTSQYTPSSSPFGSSFADSLSSPPSQSDTVTELPPPNVVGTGSTPTSGPQTIEDEILSVEYSKMNPSTFETKVEIQTEASAEYQAEESIAELMNAAASPDGIGGDDYSTATTTYVANESTTAFPQPAVPIMSQPGESSQIVASSNNQQAAAVAQQLDDEEEAVSFALGNTITSSLSVTTSKSYLANRLSLRESRTKNEKRLSRSLYEIEKTAESIERIRRKADEQVKEAENDLADKLAEIQTNVDAEVSYLIFLVLVGIIRQEGDCMTFHYRHFFLNRYFFLLCLD